MYVASNGVSLLDCRFWVNESTVDLLLSTVWTSCLTLFTTLQPVASVPAATNTAMRNPIRPRSDTPASSTETVLTVTGSPVRGYGTAACRRGISATGGPAGRRAGG